MRLGFWFCWWVERVLGGVTICWCRAQSNLNKQADCATRMTHSNRREAQGSKKNTTELHWELTTGLVLEGHLWGSVRRGGGGGVERGRELQRRTRLALQAAQVRTKRDPGDNERDWNHNLQYAAMFELLLEPRVHRNRIFCSMEFGLTWKNTPTLFRSASKYRIHIMVLNLWVIRLDELEGQNQEWDLTPRCQVRTWITRTWFSFWFSSNLWTSKLLCFCHVCYKMCWLQVS